MPETPPGAGGPSTSADSKTVRQSVPPPATDRTVARNMPPPVTLDKTVTRTGTTPDPSTARTVSRTPTNPGKTIVRSDPNARTVARPPSGAPSTRGGATGTRSGQEPDGKPFGRYRLMLELGRGGMGVVWKAYDTQLKRIVALKQILSDGEVDEEQIQRFMREARLAAKLRHPNIVGVYDVGIQDGQVYFTTDFVSGRSLDKVLKEAVAPKQAVTWVKQVAEALHYAHEQGVIHRDIKPANVLVDGKGNPFVMDFGLAKEVDQAAGVGDSNLTVSGALLGTPQYMSPEQASGRIDMLGPPTDQFSLGAMMYEMIAGRAPFKAAGLRELLNAIIEKDPLPPTQVSPKVHRDLETICLKALEKDPSRRYATIGEMAADLGRWLEGEPISARPLSSMEKWSRWAAKRRAVLIPTLAAAVLTLGFGAYAVLKRSEQSKLLEQKESAEREKASAEEARVSAEHAKTSAIEAKTTAEGDKARSEAVQKVLTRWAGLADTVRSMEEAYYDSSLDSASKQQRNAGYWRAIEGDFIAGTPDDAVSRAVMQAAAGWAARLAGLEERSRECFEEAKKNVELPYGPMMEGLVHFSEYLERQPLPRSVVDAGTVKMGDIPPETPEMKELRGRMEALLEQADRATLWGSDVAETFRKAIEAVRTLQQGDLQGAETRLSEVIRSGDLSFCRTDLQFARGKVRYLQGRFEDGLVDIEAVSKVRARHAPVHHFLGEIHRGAGLLRILANADPTVEATKAIESYGRALEARPDFYPSLLNRGLAHMDRIATLRHAGGDAIGAARAALADFDRLVAAQPRYAPGLLDRGVARRELATLGGAEGDVVEAYQRTIEDFDAALAIDPSMLEAIVNRGITWMRVAVALKLEDRDPKEAFTRSLADLDLAISKRPDPSSLFFRAYTRVTCARYGCSEDPLADCEAVLADVAKLPEGYPQAEQPKIHAMRLMAKLQKDRPPDAKAALAKAQEELQQLMQRPPSSLEEYQRRAELWYEIGYDEYAGKQDARESLGKAVADYDEAIRLNPESLDLRLARGHAWFYLAWANGIMRRVAFMQAWKHVVEDMNWVLERNPAHASALCWRGDAREQTGRYILAIEDYERELAALGGSARRTQNRLARVRKRMAGATMAMPPEWVDGCPEARRKLEAGDAAGAKAAYEAVIADAGPNAEKEPANRRHLGAVYVGVACAEAKLSTAGAKDAAFAQLKKALELGWNDAEALDTDPSLAPLRGDPRWKTLPRK